jgi:Sep-tRNA:Cys-tRNA synthetase
MRSGHKLVASSGLIGVLGVSEEFAPLIFRKSKKVEE